MADNLNTPSLPEVKPLSRRHVMAGAAAALSAMTGAAMAGAYVAATPNAKSTAEVKFAELCKNWHADHKAVEQAFEDAAAVLDSLEGFPAFPAELTQPLVATDGTLKMPGEQYRKGVPSLCWSAKDLQEIIDKGGFWHCRVVRDGDSTTIIDGIKPLPPEELKRATEMLSIAALHEQAREDALERGRVVESVPGEMNSRLWHDAMALISTEATCIASVGHKVGIAKKLDLFVSDSTDAQEIAIADIMADIEALASGAQS